MDGLPCTTCNSTACKGHAVEPARPDMGPPYLCAQCKATLGRAGQRCACGYRNVAPLGSLATVDARDLAVLNEQHEALTEDNARLRKELEAARDDAKEWKAKLGLMSLEAYDATPIFQAKQCDHEATISKLRAFSEDQARQIQRLEERLGETKDDLRDSERNFGRQARELDKLKRGQR